MIAPIALTCGEPAGVGPELALKAWQVLRGQVPFFLIADPGHMAALPGNVPLVTITDPAEAIEAGQHALPLLAHAFPAANRPGRPDS